MLLILFVISLLIVGIILDTASNKFEFAGITLWVVAGMALLIMLPVIGIQNATAEAELLKLQQEKIAIEYKIESEIYKDNFNLMDKDVITEVKEWNSKIVYCKELEKDVWVGAFIPNIYGNLELIEYKTIK